VDAHLGVVRNNRQDEQQQHKWVFEILVEKGWNKICMTMSFMWIKICRHKIICILQKYTWKDTNKAHTKWWRLRNENGMGKWISECVHSYTCTYIYKRGDLQRPILIMCHPRNRVTSTLYTEVQPKR
jgi:hypothetical protein